MSPRPTLWSAVDLVLAFVGYFLASFGPVAVVASLLLPPDPTQQLAVFGTTAVLALLSALWHVRAGKSLGPLGEFIFTVMAIQTLLIVVSIPGFYLLDWLDVAVSLPNVVGAPLVLAIYPVAYALVYRDGWRQFKARVAQSR